MKLTVRELQMIAAALLRHTDNVPEESQAILLSAHKKIIEKLRATKA